MLNLDDYVVDVLMRDLVGHDRRPASFLVYLWLISEQARRQGPVQVSYQELAKQEVMHVYWPDVNLTSSTVRVSHKPDRGWTPKALKEREIPILAS